MITNTIMTGFVKTVLPGLTVIKQNQAGKAPSLPYCAWREISSITHGRANVTYDAESAEFGENINIVKTANVEIQFYSKTESQGSAKIAQEYAGEFTARMNSTNSRFYQEENNIGLMGWKDLTPFVQHLGDIYESRANIELELSYIESYTETAYSVDFDTIDTNLTLEGI